MKHFDEAALDHAANPRQTLLTAFLAALGAVMVIPQSAAAQTAFTLPAPPFDVPLLPSPSGNWTVMVGIGGEYTPDFVGSKNGKFLPIPIFSIRRAGSVDQFRGPRDSASIALLDVGNFRAGPAFKYVSSRKSDKYAELTGLGDVKAAYELGGFVEYFPVDWLRLRSELRQGMGGHIGAVADVSADVIVPLIQRLTISAGPRFTWKSNKATAPYFSVDAAQSLASGLPMYDAKGGAHSVGFGSQISYRINPQWEVHAYVEYEKLLGDAADSPLVKLRGSSNQTAVGLGASYSFDFRIR
ncbi:MipA/OmpV family protein [Bradyrhizobium sp. 186]|uniref:MipA/OmpV family protein n=1 Tax=Bradyrhizobium sp. 186 TaxID=2782654 RepID=UPI002001A71A|nr:MipA/OmpV family protein [Bradyrhizobium sp. 186]UPK38720.1 MipA/OmpV family protein [Bradyrhizobium sp. 186]